MQTKSTVFTQFLVHLLGFNIKTSLESAPENSTSDVNDEQVASMERNQVTYLHNI